MCKVKHVYISNLRQELLSQTVGFCESLRHVSVHLVSSIFPNYN